MSHPLPCHFRILEFFNTVWSNQLSKAKAYLHHRYRITLMYYYMAEFHRFRSTVKCCTILCTIPVRNYHANISVLYALVTQTWIIIPHQIHFDVKRQTHLRDNFLTDQFSYYIYKTSKNYNQSDFYYCSLTPPNGVDRVQGIDHDGYGNLVLLTVPWKMA